MHAKITISAFHCYSQVIKITILSGWLYLHTLLSFHTKYVLRHGTQQNTHLDFDMAEVVSFMMFYEQLLGTKYKQSLNDGSTELNKSNSNLI